jgi:calcineurin-like phosphoesterase family protein
MSVVYLISDTHFGHKNIPKYRPEFSNVQEHDEFIFNSIMNTVTKRDTLWILGDIAFSMVAFNKYIVPIAEKVSVIRGCLGNHDNERLEAPSVRNYLDVGFDLYGLTKYKHAWISHAPIHPEELRGKINIHGHVHSHTISDDRYVNVSCEAINYKPISYQEIIKRSFTNGN